MLRGGADSAFTRRDFSVRETFCRSVRLSSWVLEDVAFLAVFSFAESVEWLSLIFPFHALRYLSAFGPLRPWFFTFHYLLFFASLLLFVSPAFRFNFPSPLTHLVFRSVLSFAAASPSTSAF
ncbi:hypothetical protein PC41400_24430 [Paenibacillus chitinolyticus]|uniref:Transmembrane protein n=1 Tax=Paenibacillus chitinolyticus TaxID=79263 RepID=A0A410X229_9BACL|nr:hypothetical protein PC41400_24430 [Paenibacillus chitinolyticus]